MIVTTELRNQYAKYRNAQKEETEVMFDVVRTASNINVLDTKDLHDFMEKLEHVEDKERDNIFQLGKKLSALHSKTQDEWGKLMNVPEFNHVHKFMTHMESMAILAQMPRDMAIEILQGNPVTISDITYQLEGDSYITAIKKDSESSPKE